MNEVKIGVTLPQFTSDPSTFVDGARRAEALGLDSVWVFDHLWPLSGGRERPILEGWTALAWVAAATSRIGVGTLVSRSSLRHPALLAKMAATVAAIAPGRVTIAIGSGDEKSRAENESFGFPYMAGEERLAQLRSTVEIVTRFLDRDVVEHADDFVELIGLPASPRPEQRPPVWVGGRSDGVIEIAGTTADGWNGWAIGPDEVRSSGARVRALAGGRSIEISWGGVVVLADSDDAARERLGSRSPGDRIVGSPETVAAALEGIVAAGATHVIASFADAGRPGSYELFASEVAPRVRSAYPGGV